MGAGEQVDGPARRFERGAEEGAGRALAVRPGDVEDGGKRILGAVEAVEQGADALEPEAVAGRGEFLEAVELGLDRGVGRAGEVHLVSSSPSRRDGEGDHAKHGGGV